MKEKDAADANRERGVRKHQIDRVYYKLLHTERKKSFLAPSDHAVFRFLEIMESHHSS